MLQLHEFFVEGGDQDKSHVLLHITEPSTPEEEKKGYFFAVAEINNGTVEQIEHLQQMIDDLESGYYETDDENDKNSFEISLEYINRRGHHILQEKKSTISCVVGVLRKDQLLFSYHGKPAIKVLYSKQNRFSLMDILDDEEENSQNQLFSAMMQGHLKPGDFFYVSTPHVGDNISDEQVRKILPARKAKQASEYIQKILESLRGELSYGGIIFHTPVPEKIVEEEFNKKIVAKPKKEEIKKPETHGKDKNLTKELKHSKIETNHRPRESYEKEPLMNVILITIGRSIVSGFIGLYKLLKKILIVVGKILVALLILATNKGGQRAMVLQSFNENIANKKAYVSNLPLLSKILFILTLLFAGIFVGSISYLKFKENLESKQQDYTNKIQAIVDKKTAADASMIYDDESKAFNLLKEAENMIESLPTNSQEQKNKAEDLQTEINESLKILQKLNTVEPDLLTDFTNLQTSAQAKKLALIDNTLIAYGPDDLFIYRIDLNTNKADKKDHQSIPHLAMASTPKEQDKIVFLTSNNSVAEYSPESGTLSSKEISLPNESQISSIFIYSQRLYILDTANNQLYKHSPTQTGYDKGSAWVRDSDIDLRDAVSLAIDGDLLVLKSNGEILKLVSGKQKEFTITGLDPKLDNPTEIWTYNNVENIYILEPANKRIVVLDKNGKLLQQYTAETWQNLASMIVDEASKVIYVLDSNKIYRFGIE